MLTTTTLKGHLLVVFDKDQDLSSIHALQDENRALVYIALDGTDDKYLHPEKFVVENYETSMESHFLYHGKILPEDRDAYCEQLATKFIETGKQIFIEDYEFTQAEPFYDYTK